MRGLLRRMMGMGRRAAPVMDAAPPTGFRAAPVMDAAPPTGFRPGAPRAFTPNELGPQTPVYGSPAAEGRLGMGPRANPMVEVQERQAMRDMLTKLKRERPMAQSQEELDDIDLQIAVLRRDLGLGGQ
jgi:hypothetical protein